MLTTASARALCAGALLLGVSAAQAGSISPASFSASIDVGETVVVDKTVTTDADTAIDFVDFYFLADNTGSMGGVIRNVANVSGELLNALGSVYTNAAFGVGRYLGDPSEPGVTFDSAYDVMQPITTNRTAVTTAVGNWFASGGGDGPEANLYALQQAATNGANTAGPNTGSGESTGWRAGAQKVVLWFGDVVGHQNTVTLANAISALNDEDVIVVALNSRGAGSGIDGSFAEGTSDARNQSSTIAAATAGAEVDNFASVNINSIVSTIVGAIGTVTATIDLSLAVLDGNTGGLDISFACTDPLGCDGVTPGESRTLSMTVTGLAPGTYNFRISAPGVSGTIETDSIVVGGGSFPAPAPAPLALLGVGLTALARVRRRR